IKGNLAKEDKQILFALLQVFVGTVEKQVYSAQVGERMKCVEMSIWGEKSTCTGQAVFEVTVEKDMCNTFDTLHAGCAAYMVDPCTVASLFITSTKTGKDAGGFTQSMNLIWHNPVQRGAKIRIIATSVAAQGRIRTMRCEIWNNDILCVSAVHSTVKPPPRR
ncbi:hypothetical protein BJ912DRAFT_823736, partial [Pholiota molesta]